MTHQNSHLNKLCALGYGLKHVVCLYAMILSFVMHHHAISYRCIVYIAIAFIPIEEASFEIDHHIVSISRNLKRVECCIKWHINHTQTLFKLQLTDAGILNTHYSLLNIGWAMRCECWENVNILCFFLLLSQLQFIHQPIAI